MASPYPCGLNEREALALAYRWTRGTPTGRPPSHYQLARMLGVSHQAVGQWEARAIQKLRGWAGGRGRPSRPPLVPRRPHESMEQWEVRLVAAVLPDLPRPDWSRLDTRPRYGGRTTRTRLFGKAAHFADLADR